MQMEARSDSLELGSSKGHELTDGGGGGGSGGLNLTLMGDQRARRREDGRLWDVFPFSAVLGHCTALPACCYIPLFFAKHPSIIESTA